MKRGAILAGDDRTALHSRSFPYVSKFLHPFSVLPASFLLLFHSVLVPRAYISRPRFSPYKQPGRRNRTSTFDSVNSARRPDDLVGSQRNRISFIRHTDALVVTALTKTRTRDHV